MGGRVLVLPGRRPRRRSGPRCPRRCSCCPEISLARTGDETAVTANVVCRPGDDAAALVERAAGEDRLAAGRRPAADRPGPGRRIRHRKRPARRRSTSARSPRVRAACGRGRSTRWCWPERCRCPGARPFNPGAVFAALRSGYPSCYCFCVGTPEAAFLGASPELLVRRAGAVVSTVALAGSARRSADPSVDDHLGERLLHSPKDLDEHRIVVGTIERSLEPRVRMGGRRGRAGAREGREHPAPRDAGAGAARRAAERGGAGRGTASDLRRGRRAVERRGAAGAPAGAAGPRLVCRSDRLDGRRRGRRAVRRHCAARSCRARTAHCYAGGGMVADSDPEAELAETEVKLQAIVPALTGA